MSKMVLWGFDGSTYVRTVKMLLAEKGVTQFEQMPLNVLKGEPKMREHLQRHPFGKVPVLDHDGMRLLETSAIVRYLNEALSARFSESASIIVATQPRSGCVCLKLCSAWIFAHQPSKPATLNTAALSGVSET